MHKTCRRSQQLFNLHCNEYRSDFGIKDNELSLWEPEDSDELRFEMVTNKRWSCSEETWYPFKQRDYGWWWPMQLSVSAEQKPVAMQLELFSPEDKHRPPRWRWWYLIWTGRGRGEESPDDLNSGLKSEVCTMMQTCFSLHLYHDHYCYREQWIDSLLTNPIQNCKVASQEKSFFQIFYHFKKAIDGKSSTVLWCLPRKCGPCILHRSGSLFHLSHLFFHR